MSKPLNMYRVQATWRDERDRIKKRAVWNVLAINKAMAKVWFWELHPEVAWCDLVVQPYGS